MDRLSFSSSVFALFLDTSSTVASVDVVFLDTFLDRWLDTSLHLYLSRIIEALYIGLLRFSSYFLNFSWSVRTCSPSKSLSLTPNLFPKCFSSIFKDFSSFGKIRFSHFHAFLSLKPKFWDFCKIWGFSKSKRFLCNFWDGFWRFTLKNFMHCIPCAL